MSGIFDTGIFDTGIFDHAASAPPVVTQPDYYAYGPSKEAVARMYAVLFGDTTPKKKPRRKAKLEKVALELLREIDPGPDLPPLDVSALVAAINLLDAPVNLKPTQQQKSAIIEALLTQAQKIRDDDADIDDLIKALAASETLH